VTSHEAAWKLFNFKIFHKSHTIYRLPVHLSNQQPVFFQAGNEEEALARAVNNNTKLTAWFDLNKHDSLARKYLYNEIPYHFSFDQKTRPWIRRKNSHKTVSRMYAVSPKEGERYFLRLRLLHQRGVRSFEELKTVDNILCNSFREACLALNLLENDEEWDRCLTEASNFKMPRQ
jgi:ATP-dependent DNA helicase PIF1